MWSGVSNSNKDSVVKNLTIKFVLKASNSTAISFKFSIYVVNSDVLISRFHKPSRGQVNVLVITAAVPSSSSVGTLNVAVYLGVTNLFNKNFSTSGTFPCSALTVGGGIATFQGNVSIAGTSSLNFNNVINASV